MEPIAIAAASYFTGDPQKALLLGTTFNSTYKTIKKSLDDYDSEKKKEKAIIIMI